MGLMKRRTRLGSMIVVIGTIGLLLPIDARSRERDMPFETDLGDSAGGCEPDFAVERNGSSSFTLTTSEDMYGYDGFTLRLGSRPPAFSTVRVRVQSSNPQEGLVLYDLVRYGTGAASSFVDFTFDYWGPLERTIYVIGVFDNVPDSDKTYSVTVRNIDRQDPYCDPVVTIPAVNRDNSFQKLDLYVTDAQTDANGGLASVLLRPQCNYGGCLPTSDLTVEVTSGNPAQGLVKGPSDTTFQAATTLRFTQANMQIYQTVQVRGMDDGHANGDHQYEVSFLGSSTDPRWTGVSATMPVTNVGPTDASQCINGVGVKFLALPQDGSQLAIRDYGFPAGEYFGGLSYGNHFQGIQRARRGAYLFISGKGDSASDLFTARLNKDGSIFQGRWGHNLPPDPDEVVIWHAAIDGDYDHAGGISVFGDFLAVPLQFNISSGGVPVDGLSKVVIYNVFNPAAPVRLAEVVRRPDNSAGAVAVAKLTSGFFTNRYLMAVESDSDRQIQFYLSSGAGIRGSSEVFPESYWAWSTADNNAPNYNNINFIQECGGPLYMIGTYNSGLAGSGTNIADLYVVIPPERLPNGAVTAPSLDYLASHIFDCNDGHWCNFSAGAGAYAASTGDLILYSTHFYRNLKDGWFNFTDGDGILRMKEF